MLSFAPLLGPIAGAYLQMTFGWRAAFVVLTAFALAFGIAVWGKLGETNQHRNPEAMQLAGLARNYGAILRAPVFWAYTLPGALSYASIFVFISGASFALIIGTWIGASHDGTLYPMALISAAVGIALFGAARAFARFRG